MLLGALLRQAGRLAGCLLFAVLNSPLIVVFAVLDGRSLPAVGPLTAGSVLVSVADGCCPCLTFSQVQSARNRLVGSAADPQKQELNPRNGR